MIRNEAARAEVLRILAAESKSPPGATRRYARHGYVSEGVFREDGRVIARYYNEILVHEEFTNAQG